MIDYFRSKRQPKEKANEVKDENATASTAATTTATDKGKGKEKETIIQDAPRNDEPVLNEEDEAFLTRIISAGPEETPPPLPERPESTTARSTDAQYILMHGADSVPLPDAPETPEGEVAKAIEGEQATTTAPTATDSKVKTKNNRWSWMQIRRSSSRSAARNDTAAGLQSAAESLKTAPKPADAKPNEGGQVAPGEAAKEESEMASVLEQLNLSSVNNRVFSISDESKELLQKFTLVLKDLVNGVPTAYHDLESLLTNSDQQLQKGYKSLPPFLQELIEKLPEKFGKSLGPEFLAAAAEKQGVKSSGSAYFTKGASAAEKLGVKIKVPSLKDLVTKQGTLIALLRSVMQALRTRFPAFLGMNVLWSLALFVLLFVFWYCHKRGREVRLEKERKLTEEEMAQIAARVAADPAWVPPEGWDVGGGGSQGLTTRAPEGASIEEVRAGMLMIEDGAEEETAVGADGRAAYAPEGSLGRAMRKEEEKKEEKKVKVQ